MYMPCVMAKYTTATIAVTIADNTKIVAMLEIIVFIMIIF
jgi:hypothetical protein